MSANSGLLWEGTNFDWCQNQQGILKERKHKFLRNNAFVLMIPICMHRAPVLDVKVWMGGQYNFITIFYFFDIQAPISIRNFSSNKIFFKISLQEWKVGV